MSGLYRFRGDGDAQCEDCVRDTIEANPGMNPSDWPEDEFGDTTCDSCDATVVKEVVK